VALAVNTAVAIAMPKAPPKRCSGVGLSTVRDAADRDYQVLASSTPAPTLGLASMSS
jgi:hypothetical protein